MPTQDDFTNFMNDHRSKITDSSIKGYMIEAGRRTGIPRERIQDMIEEIKLLLKYLGPDEAAKIFENF